MSHHRAWYRSYRIDPGMVSLLKVQKKRLDTLNTTQTTTASGFSEVWFLKKIKKIAKHAFKMVRLH